MAGGTVAHSSWSSAGKYCHGFYGSVRNFPNNPNNVMYDEVFDMLKMSYDLISHHLQRPYGIQALTGQGGGRRCETSREPTWRDRWRTVRNQGAGDPRTGGGRRRAGDT